MLALLTVRAAPRAIPGVSAMLALLTVRAGHRAIPRVCAMLYLQSEMLPELFLEFYTMRCPSSTSIWEASSTQYLS